MCYRFKHANLQVHLEIEASSILWWRLYIGTFWYLSSVFLLSKIIMILLVYIYISIISRRSTQFHTAKKSSQIFQKLWSYRKAISRFSNFSAKLGFKMHWVIHDIQILVRYSTFKSCENNTFGQIMGPYWNIMMSYEKPNSTAICTYLVLYIVNINKRWIDSGPYKKSCCYVGPSNQKQGWPLDLGINIT